MDKNKIDFKEIVRKIENKEILLPDFQRGFIWKEEERQRKIVASVLARMPIGSILLLKSKPDEYASKIIGYSEKVKVQDLNDEVEFLLDGQQRITVLVNVFSNVIFEQCLKFSKLNSLSLKRRFFLRIPRWSKCKAELDLFGVYDLVFKYQNPDSEEPDFLSGDILRFIECNSFLSGDNKPFNPQVSLSTDLDNFCLSYKDGYLIPLYLLAPSENNKNKVMLRYKTILENISRKLGGEIIDYYVGLENDTDKENFINQIFIDENERKFVKKDIGNFKNVIDERQQLWGMHLDNYLQTCVKSVSLNRIVVEEEKRARAIDIYENLNRGGVSLNTFDLIMARVAKVSKDNFYDRIVTLMHNSKTYYKNVLPDYILRSIEHEIKEKSYNATLRTDCYNKKNEIVSKYIDAFLDVLSLYCNNKEFANDSFKPEHLKKEYILKLEPDEIDKNCGLACQAIDRALFFFQTRCGIRSIQEINYSLMLVLVATIFIKDEYFKNKKVHDKIEAWYWASVFSGEYDKDQNITMINHLKKMIEILQGKQGTQWITSLKDNIFNMQNFSDKKLLLMEKVEEERYPKNVLKNFICQYLLAKTYVDVFDPNKKIDVFCKESKELEAHHIIPLGSVRKVGETTEKLRNDPKHICNSPLNFVYITKESNKEISSDPLEVYINKICNEAKAILHIESCADKTSIDTDEKIKNLLGNRFTSLEGDIKNHIFNLLQ